MRAFEKGRNYHPVRQYCTLFFNGSLLESFSKAPPKRRIVLVAMARKLLIIKREALSEVNMYGNRRRKVCKHKNLVYLGKQPITLKADRFLYLFNCTVCKTTISVPPRKERKAS